VSVRQQIDESRYWWRRADGPTRGIAVAQPALVIEPVGGTSPRSRRMRRGSTKAIVRTFVAAGAGAAAFFLMTAAGTELRTLEAVTSRIERAAGLSGTRADAVAISGHRFTSEADIFAAAGLGRAGTTPPADLLELRRRLEALPWVEAAAVERVLPDGLSVAIKERRPIAIWRRTNPMRQTLIDGTGRELSDITGSAGDLPIVVGDGAPAATAALIGVLAGHPDLMARLEAAERIGARRWSLRLAGLPLVLLPETGEAAALDDLARLLASTDPAAIAVIDLRVRHRADVRPAPPRRS
jgi:cell division protein FtsQ